MGVTVVRPSSAQREGLAAFLAIAFGLALVRGLVGAESETGRIVVAVVFGGGLALIVVGWLRVLRNPELLEVGDELIRLASSSERGSTGIDRQRGDHLRFAARSAGRVSFLALTQPTSGTSLTLQLFSRKKVRAACEAHGWRFDP